MATAQKPLSARQVEARLGKIAKELDQNEARYAERLELWERGVELGFTHDQLGEWSNKSGVAVSKALSKARKQR